MTKRKAVQQARRKELEVVSDRGGRLPFGVRFRPTTLGLHKLAMTKPDVRYWHRMVY